MPVAKNGAKGGNIFGDGAFIYTLIIYEEVE